MGKLVVSVLLGCALALTSLGTLTAQGTVPAKAGAAAPTTAELRGLDVLKGSWVRPDGGYTIAIKSIGPKGALEAKYFNPNQLPFAKAQASLEGATLRSSSNCRRAATRARSTSSPTMRRVTG